MVSFASLTVAQFAVGSECRRSSTSRGRETPMIDNPRGIRRRTT
jgi:hypothetical protein